MYTLYIANKNYSSWSMRPWVLMRALGIDFQEKQFQFTSSGGPDFHTFSPSGRVPCLHHGEMVVWDSLAIIEYLAERHPGVWPSLAEARAWARSATAEMHSGFGNLRNDCSMSVGVRVRMHRMSDALKAELSRLQALWTEGLTRFGGPFLAGTRFTAVDAFYAPVATRIQTYGLPITGVAGDYAAMLLKQPAVAEWIEAGMRETWRDVPHEKDILAAGEVLQDFRA